jgi:hypothetical protein
MTAADLARVDVPLTQLADELRALKAKALREGLLAEQRHQFLDLDADSVCCLPGTACVACPPKTAGGAS